MSLKHLAAVLTALVCVLSLGCTAFAIDSPDDPYVVTLYNESNGLPTGEANEVIQTSDGYVWMGSYGGLIRYDGTNFRNFSLEERIESSSIRALIEDSSGRLWIGTNDAGVFVMENGEISHIPCESESSFLCIRDFAVASDGTVYAASNSGIAYVKDGTLIPAEGEHAVGGTVYSVDVDGSGRVWGALNGGVVVVLKNGREERTYSSADLFPGGDEIYCTGSDDKGRIYLGTSGQKLARLPADWDGDASKAEFIETPGVTTHNMIRTGPDGSVIVCGNVGACVILKDGRQITFGENDHAASLNSGCMDYEGNIWLASTSFGIIKYTEGCYESPNLKAGLSGIPLNAIIKQGGLFFIATDTGILCYTSDWEPVTNSLTELYDDVRVRSLAADSDGNVWAATYDTKNTVACFDPETDGIKTYGTAEGLLSNGARTVYMLSDGSVAVGTQQGLNIIKNGEITASYGTAEGLSTPSVLCTVETPSGSVLVGSDGGGIYEITKSGEVINHGFSEGLSEGVVLRILLDEQSGGYFVSAGSSLYFFDGSAFTLLPIQKGAGSVFDFTLRDGCLWILQNNGILRYDREAVLSGETVSPKEYGFEYGLSGSLNANTWNWIDPEDGSLYLATRSGVSVFEFGGVENAVPKAIINGVSVDGSEMINPQSVELKSDVNRITIDFSALTYTGTSDVVMEYILEGFDKEATVADGSTASVSYTNLPGGDYSFILTVYDPEEPEKATVCRVEIAKDKKIYEHPVFFAGIMILAAAAIAGVVLLFERAKVRSAEKRQREYRDIVEQSLQTFARAIDAKDKYTNGHSLRVAEYSVELAKRLGLSPKEQENVYYIALLHDIGKIGIPDSILNKPGKLTDEERKLIQNHPLIGGEILRDFTAIDGIADGAKFHHERIDGNGYNKGLKGDEIPLIARIIGVADTYDAMSSTRCYRPALSEDFIVEELKRVAGTQLDERIVPHMLDMISEGIAPLANDAHKEAHDIASHYKT